MVIDQKWARLFDRRAVNGARLLNAYYAHGVLVGEIKYTVGYYQSKAPKTVTTAARLVVDDFGDCVPTDYHPWWRNLYPLDDQFTGNSSWVSRCIYHC